MRPKQFLPLLNGDPLYRLTYDRAALLVGPQRILVVTTAPMLRHVRRLTPELPPGQIIVEGEGRNTAPSAGLAAEWIRRRHGDGYMVILPSDHQISTAKTFRADVTRACRAAQRAGRPVLVGVLARSAESGLGYVRRGAAAGLPGVHRVRSFIEKPKAAQAKRMLRSQQHLWNTGITVWRATDLLGELRRRRPRLAARIARTPAAVAERPWRLPAATMRHFTNVSVDHALMVGNRRLLMIEGRFRWSDLGNWEALTTPSGRLSRGRRGAGALITLDAPGCRAWNDRGVTVMIGVKDVIAARCGDVMLICDRRMVQRVGELPRRLTGAMKRYR